MAYLEPRHILIVLDNCEHLVDACASLVERLLAACPSLWMLATSREPLRIPGETTWRVPSLAFPDPRRLPPLADLSAIPSVHLFTERAQAARADFILTADNCAAVALVCARLEGIPLALELAAARIRVLSVEQITARLDDTFRLLTGGSRTAPGRQQTLKATLDWSHALLSAPEQRLFRRLAVLAGGWLLEAAEAICTGDGVEQSDVLDLLTNLVDKSLVQADQGHDEIRYRLLEPVRQYARDQLVASGEWPTVCEQHGRYHLAVAEQIANEITRGCVYAPFGTPRQVHLLSRLEQDHANFRAALDWFASSGETGLALRMSTSLWLFWFLQGHLAEASQWLERALAEEEEVTLPSRPIALGQLGLVAWAQADYARAAALHTQAVAGFRARGDNRNLALCLNFLGVALGFGGQFDEGRRALEESITLFRGLDDGWGVGIGLFDLGKVARSQGEANEARSTIEHGLVLLREAGDLAQSAEALTDLAGIAEELGDTGRVVTLACEAIELLQRMNSPYFLPDCLELLAGAAAARKQFLPAARLFGAAEALREATATGLDPSRSAAYARHLGAVRASLSDGAFATAWAAGRKLRPEQAVDEALRISRPPQRVSPAEVELGGLTAREREVTVLLARGLTNKEIARVLVIADGTVNIHVTNILGKLGFHSRAQVAGWAVQHGLVDKQAT
jgi:non-specific serine/threonine protein kinase